jgi:hypothetical protein
MSEDIEYLANYLPERLYTHPGKAGTYTTTFTIGAIRYSQTLALIGR